MIKSAFIWLVIGAFAALLSLAVRWSDKAVLPGRDPTLEMAVVFAHVFFFICLGFCVLSLLLSLFEDAEERIDDSAGSLFDLQR